MNHWLTIWKACFNDKKVMGYDLWINNLLALEYLMTEDCGFNCETCQHLPESLKKQVE